MKLNDGSLLTKLNLILRYGREYGLNFNSICGVFELNEEELEKTLKSKLHYYGEENQKLINKILDSKNERCNVKISDIRKIYIAELKEDAEVIKIIKNYKEGKTNITKEEIEAISIFRLKNNISRKNFSEKTGIGSSLIINREKLIDDQKLKSNLDALSDSNLYGRIRRK